MRLSGTSIFGQQNSLINVERINQSVAKQPHSAHSAKGTHMMQMRRDRLTLSPQGKVSSVIESLNKQKANILERRDQFLEQARKQGQSEDMIKPQLEQFDQQIKDIDKQIQEATLQKMKDAAEKSDPKVKSNKPKTKQDVQNDILANITAASTTLDRVETISSEKNKLDGNVGVLKSEIELDKSRDSTGSGKEAIAAKEELVAQMQSRSQGLMQDISDSMSEANEILEENNDLATTEPVEDDKDTGKVNGKDDKDTSKVNSKDDQDTSKNDIKYVDVDRADVVKQASDTAEAQD